MLYKPASSGKEDSLPMGGLPFCGVIPQRGSEQMAVVFSYVETASG